MPVSILTQYLPERNILQHAFPAATNFLVSVSVSVSNKAVLFDLESFYISEHIRLDEIDGRDVITVGGYDPCLLYCGAAVFTPTRPVFSAVQAWRQTNPDCPHHVLPCGHIELYPVFAYYVSPNDNRIELANVLFGCTTAGLKVIKLLNVQPQYSWNYHRPCWLCRRLQGYTRPRHS
ncbi:hypothetical protein K491DRAFT_674885 [Lophiostoma macrostomum CBS 122681]|uniref:Uncharacterized protein n=1 Tax=Lophiostoma macrostomum CBS 122681 TaxID=1314788 RepID=A0A6A6TKW7_9PLEO|nr:hypothetical protein K491DRAFT_674885 [Lophiostoma macrostomum CBS 122681]